MATRKWFFLIRFGQWIGIGIIAGIALAAISMIPNPPGALQVPPPTFYQSCGMVAISILLFGFFGAIRGTGCYILQSFD